jgi:hypothetical protein
MRRDLHESDLTQLSRGKSGTRKENEGKRIECFVGYSLRGHQRTRRRCSYKAYAQLKEW